jgi:hypothetical protein
MEEKIAAVESRQKNHGNITLQEEKGMVFMWSVEFMNLLEGFPCNSIGCPLGSLRIFVELI